MKNMKKKSCLFLSLTPLLLGCPHSPPLPEPPQSATRNWCDVLKGTRWAQFECSELIGSVSLGSWGPKGSPNENDLSAILPQGGASQLFIKEEDVILPEYSSTVRISGSGDAGLKLNNISSWAPDITVGASGSRTFTIQIKINNMKRRSIQNYAPLLRKRAIEVRDTAIPEYFPIRQALYNLCKPEYLAVTEVLVGTPSIILKAERNFALNVAAGWQAIGLKSKGDNTGSAEWKLDPQGDQRFVLAANRVFYGKNLETEELCSRPPQGAGK